MRSALLLLLLATASFGQFFVRQYTVATLPTLPTINQSVVVTDAISPVDCSVGNGSPAFTVVCRWNGAAWVSAFDASGTATAAVSAFQSALLPNLNAAMGATPPYQNYDLILQEPITGGNPGLASARPGTLIAQRYQFSQMPGTVIGPGPTTLTLSPCPSGLYTTNPNYYLNIQSGTGTAEVVLVTGGTCTSNLASGTVSFTASNSHSGAYQVTSATDGIQEAICMASGPVYVQQSSVVGIFTDLNWCGLSQGHLIVENGVTVVGAGHLPTSIGTQYLVEDYRYNPAPAQQSWSAISEQGQITPFDEEFHTILLGGYNWSSEVFRPRGTNISSSNLMTLGWNTPGDAGCASCSTTQLENVLGIGVIDNNTKIQMNGMQIAAWPGVDNWGGLWGMNIEVFNNTHSNTVQGGIFGIEINVGIDGNAIDEPNVAISQQINGLVITESSPTAHHRTTADIWLDSAGGENPHAGLVITGINAPDPIDQGIVMTGPITWALDLHQVTNSSFTGMIWLPENQSIAFSDDSGSEKPVLAALSGNITRISSLGSSIVLQNAAENMNLAIFNDTGGFLPTRMSLASIVSVEGSSDGRWFACTDCSVPVTSGSTCTNGSASSVAAVVEGGAVKCF